MPESNSDFPSEADLKVLGEFASEIRASRARRESISAEDLGNGTTVTTDYLCTGWNTGGGRRLRQFCLEPLERLASDQSLRAFTWPRREIDRCSDF